MRISSRINFVPRFRWKNCRIFLNCITPRIDNFDSQSLSSQAEFVVCGKTGSITGVLIVNKYECVPGNSDS